MDTFLPNQIVRIINVSRLKENFPTHFKNRFPILPIENCVEDEFSGLMTFKYYESTRHILVYISRSVRVKIQKW